MTTVAPGFTKNDRGVYIGTESAKGTPATVMKGASALTDFNMKPNKLIIPGRSVLGGGSYKQRSIGYGYDVDGDGSGWWTPDLFPALLWNTLATKGTTTAVGTTGYRHPYTLRTRNSTMGYCTVREVVGETSVGSGIMVLNSRDARITKFSVTIKGNDAQQFSFNLKALNAGPGEASPTLTFNTGFNPPNPGNVSNIVTFPAAWWPAWATLCLDHITISWDSGAVDGPVGIARGERADTFLPETGWELEFGLMMTTDMVQVFNEIYYGSNSPGATSGELSSALKEGGFFCKTVSDTTIPSSSPVTPFGTEWNFPDLQWSACTLDGGTPNMATVKATSFGSTATMAVENATSGVLMAA